MSTAKREIVIFLGSPGGLEAERAHLRHVVEEYNASDAQARGFGFRVFGWEDLAGGAGAPQDQINPQLSLSDYVVFMFADRWGSPPRPGDSRTSATQEEVEIAEAGHGDPSCPIADILILFKELDPERIANQDEQLQQVLKYKARLESEKRHFFKEFGSKEELGDRARRKLGEWLLREERALSGRQPIQAIVTEQRLGPPEGAEVVGAALAKGRAFASAKLVDEALRLSASGRRVDAEAKFSEAIVSAQDVLAYDQYGEFLSDSGRRAQALVMIRRAEQVAREAGLKAYLAVGGWRRGLLQLQAGDLDAAEATLNEATTTARSCGASEFVPVLEAARAGVMLQRGALEQARQLCLQVLEDLRNAPNASLEAHVHLRLANIAFTQNDVDEAEARAKASLDCAVVGGVSNAVPPALIGLGNAHWKRGNIDEAERMYNEALAKLLASGRVEGLLKCKANLAIIAISRGQLDGAEAILGEVRREATERGYAEVVMSVAMYEAKCQAKRGCWPEAETLHREALELARGCGFMKDAAESLGNLGTDLRKQGRSKEALEAYDEAIGLYRGMGLETRALDVEKSRRKVPPSPLA